MKNIKISTTQDGSPYDNAIAERVNGILKREWLNDETFRDIQQVKKRVEKVVEIYNNGRPHYSPDLKTPNTTFFDLSHSYDHKSYSATTFEKSKAKVELVSYTDEDGISYCVDPATTETETLLKNDGYTYQAAEMRETLLLKLKDVDFNQFRDADFQKLDFSAAAHKVTIGQGDVIAFKTSNGRKGVLNVKIQSNFPMIQCKYQAIAQ